MQSLMGPLRQAIELAVTSTKAAVRRKAVAETIPKIVDELTRLSAGGGTRRTGPKELNAVCTAAARLASMIRLKDAKDFDQLKASEDFTLALEKAVRAMDDCDLSAMVPSKSEAETELEVTRSHNAAAMDALSALKGALGDRVVPVMQSHGTRGSDA